MKLKKWLGSMMLACFFFGMASPLWAVTYDGVQYIIPPGLVNGYSAGKVPPQLVLMKEREVAGVMHPVVTIGKNAFSNCTALEHVVIPETIQTIENSAFRRCSSLKSIVFNHKDSFPTLGVSIFWGCNKLDTITVETEAMAEMIRPKIKILENPPQILIRAPQNDHEDENNTENEKENGSGDLSQDNNEGSKEDVSDSSGNENSGKDNEGEQEENPGAQEKDEPSDGEEQNGDSEKENDHKEDESEKSEDDSNSENSEQDDSQEENPKEENDDTGSDEKKDSEEEQEDTEADHNESTDGTHHEHENGSDDQNGQGNENDKESNDNEDGYTEETKTDNILMIENIDQNATDILRLQMMQETYTAALGGSLMFGKDKVTAKAAEGYAFWKWSDGEYNCQRIMMAEQPVVAWFIEENEIPYQMENGIEKPLVWSAVRMQKLYIGEKDEETIYFKDNEITPLFSDIAGHSRQQALQFVIDRQLFQGTGKHMILPDAPMTQAMCAVVAQKLLENPQPQEEANWYHFSWQQGKASGILPESWTNPQESVTAAEFCALLQRAANERGISGPKLIYGMNTINRAEAAVMIQQFITLALSQNEVT